MPIYGYACQECEHSLDALQKIADAPLVDCPSCGSASLKRLLSAPRFRLKGQGWYETDFKKNNQRNLHGEKDSQKSPGKPASDSTSKTKSSTSAKSKTA